MPTYIKENGKIFNNDDQNKTKIITEVKFTEEQFKALDFSKHGIVTANAGSGKTKVFSTRFVNIALGIAYDENKKIISTNPVDVRRIVAITFTDKAASELYVKIAKEVDERISNNEIENEHFTKIRANIIAGNKPEINDEEILKSYGKLISQINETDENKIDQQVIKLIEEKIPVNTRNIEKLSRLRRNLVSANISTIHSFCSNILKRFPLKAGLDVSFTPIDKRISNELIELSIDEVSREILETKDHPLQNDLKNLIRILGSKMQFVEAMTKILNDKRNDIADLKESIYSKSKDQIAEYFAKEFDEAMKEIFVPSAIKFYESLDIIGKDIEKKLPELNPAPRRNAQANLDLLNNILISYKTEIKEFEQVKNFIKELIDSGLTKDNGKSLRNQTFAERAENSANEISFCNNYLELFSKFPVTDNRAELEINLAGFGISFIKIFDAINSHYEKSKKENGFLDFEDILIKAKNLVKHDKDVVAELQKEIDYIMIDEYQDTNQLQYDLVIPVLTEIANKVNEKPEKLKRENGNLFVVGDEKQSIYMFRNADLKVFNDTAKDIFNSCEQEKKNLPHSFRMAANNCLFTNFIFENLLKVEKDFNISDKFNQVENSNLVCGIGKSPKGLNLLGKVEFLLANKDDANLPEADLVARKIKLLCNEENFAFDKNDKDEEIKLSYKNIAVLVRKKKSFEALEKSFVEYSIPYVIVGGKGFYGNQVIKDIYNYLAFLVNQNDDVALAGVLRSPFFSVSDSGIYKISLVQGETFWKKFQNYVKDLDEKNDLKKVQKILKENITTSKRIDISVLMRKILGETAFLTVLSSRKNGKQDIANVEKLIKIAGDFEKNNYSTLFDFVDHLKTSLEENPDEAQAAVSGDEDVVKIMTVHQSKGLEFPAVILFECHDEPQKDKVASGSINISRDFGIITKVLNENYFNERAEAPICNLYKFIQNKREEAEYKRLLYVAMTRAAYYLGISGSYKIKDNKLKFDPTSFLGIIEEALPVSFLQVVTDKKLKITRNLEIYQNGKEVIEKLDYEVPVILDLPENKGEFKDDQKQDYQFLLDENKNYKPSEDKFTATKYADIIEGKDNYYKKYVLRIDKLNGLKKENISSDENSLRGLETLKGTVIHSILSRDLSPEKIDENLIEQIVKNEIDFPYAKSDEIKTKFIKEIEEELRKYFASGIYNDISKHKDCNNEYELWHFDEEHQIFLQGIIDKYIVAGDEARIVDYKSNDISEKEIEKKLEYYYPQLKFYAAVLSKKYPDIKKFTIQIIFTKFPEIICEKEILAEGLYEEVIKEIAGTNF